MDNYDDSAINLDDDKDLNRSVSSGYIMGYKVAQKGAYFDVGLSKKNLYNCLNSKIRGQIKDGADVAALSYLSGKASSDPILYAKFTTIDDGRLKQLFWADGCSISDFLCFNDVLAIHTTHEKNKCKYPLVIFSGCNHHSQTILFGCALVSDETIETYKWVLKTFSEAMRNKHPKVVVTNGNEVMMEAIKHVFPNACHRLCAWHLHKIACEKVTSSAFSEDFKKAIYSNFTPEELEVFWIKMVVRHGIVGNEWVSKTYENRSLWATAYLCDEFFGCIQTSSQCEDINSIIEEYIKKECSVLEFMHDFEQTWRKYRNDELMADNKSLFSKPVLTTSLQEYEKDAAKIYTAEIFKEVKEHVVLACAFYVSEGTIQHKKTTFKLTSINCHPNIEIKVHETSKSIYSCACRHFESRGIPCSHIFQAMTFMRIDHIPSSLILTRWTKNAKIALMSSNSSKEKDYGVMEFAQFRILCDALNRLWQLAVKNNWRHYDEIMDDMLKLTEKYKMVGLNIPKNKKFGTKRASHCSKCSSTKHNVKTCPMHVGINDKSVNSDQLSHPEYSKFSKAADTDKEIVASDLNNGLDIVGSTNLEVYNDKKEELSDCCNRKQKKAKELTQKSNNDGTNLQVGCASGGQHVNSQVQSILPQMQFSPYGYVTSSQGPWNFPNFSGVPIYNTQLPILPQYYYGVPVYYSDTSHMGLLQETMKNCGQTSEKDVHPR